MRVDAIPVVLVLALLAWGIAGCSTTGPDDAREIGSSRAYRGHETDLDMNNFIAGYPALVGTRLDDCQTCHRGGEVDYPERTVCLNPCSYCHLIPYPDEEIISGAPADYEGALNPYGLDYLNSGRTRNALSAIAGWDSDEDAFSNQEELAAGRYPGDAESKPGQPLAPVLTFGWDELHALATHTQFLLLNSHKQQYDSYAVYTGVTMPDLLEAAGVDLADATGITVIAPDGFAQDFTLDDVAGQYPGGLYFANLDPGSFADPNQGFVTYPDPSLIPEGLEDGGTIPDEQWLLVAYGRDGVDLDISYLDPVTGKIEGEGPYRLVVPQTAPGAPDRGSRYSPSAYDDRWDYDPQKDHNAGLCVRGVAAIRVNPMPGGYEEFDWKNGGWALVAGRELVIYGEGAPGTD